MVVSFSILSLLSGRSASALIKSKSDFMGTFSFDPADDENDGDVNAFALCVFAPVSWDLSVLHPLHFCV